MTSLQDQFFTCRQAERKLKIALELCYGSRHEYGDISPFRSYVRARAFSALQLLLFARSGPLLPASDGSPQENGFLFSFLQEDWIDPAICRRAIKSLPLPFYQRILLLQKLYSLENGTPFTPPLQGNIACNGFGILQARENLVHLLPHLQAYLLSIPLKEYPGLTSFAAGSEVICFDPKSNVPSPTYTLLHLLIHLLWHHPLGQKGRDPLLWQLACDLSTVHLIRQLCPDHFQEIYSDLKSQMKAQGADLLWDSCLFQSPASIYSSLTSYPQGLTKILAGILAFDDHRFWISIKTEALAKRHFLEKSVSRKEGNPKGKFGYLPGSRQEKLFLRRQAKYNFHSWLEKFTITAEELQVDLDSIDLIPYLFGLQTYGNLPLVEYLEYTEAQKVEELVIAIDTSGSCSLLLVQQFLAECRKILTDRRNFFKKMHVHIFQCDSMIQDHVIIRSVEDWKLYSSTLKIQGRGGTDFTPVFRQVDQLIQEGHFANLRALLYFTDGDGAYPRQEPAYETAFVFSDQRFLDHPRPPWILPLCLDLPLSNKEPLA